jgi:glycine/D-amino acid oxidase-like deaminating enzyme
MPDRLVIASQYKEIGFHVPFYNHRQATLRLKSNNSPFARLPQPISREGIYQPVSYWQETVAISPGRPLARDISCDVAVIGGGFSGLSTAYEVKRANPNLEVVLLERTVIGHGASGRNGGFVMPLIGWDLLHVARKLGDQTAGQLYRLMYDAVAHTKRVIAENQIECDLEETGYLFLATCHARMQRLRRELETALQLGLDHEWLEGTALGDHVRSDAFLAGVFDPHPAILNPAKLACGLKTLVEQIGVHVYEQTSLEHLVDGDPIVLRTASGRILADQVVLAVNGYGAALGFMRSRIYPVHTYIVLTEPLDDAALESTGWSARRTSLETDRNFIHYFRLTADNRILFGGEDATLYYGGKLLDHHLPTFQRLEARFRAYFPSLAGVTFTHRWGGVLGVTIDMLPTFGVGGDHGTIYHAAGYSGHGVALANYAGRILAPHILKRAGSEPSGEPVPSPLFFGRKPVPLPLQPLRYVGLQAYRAALHAQDAWQRA